MSWQDGLRAEIVRAIDDYARLPIGALTAAADAVLDKVQARIDAAREQVAEQIAQAIEEARPTHEHVALLEGLDISARARVIIACDHAARIAREHAKGNGDE